MPRSDYVRIVRQDTARVYMLSYNNYFNRTIKIAGDLVSNYAPRYQLKAYNSAYALVQSNTTGFNFDPGNGINTELIVNWNNYPVGDPDYVVVSEEIGYKTADASAGDYLVTSRWFVISVERTRGRQVRLYLRRDVVADFNAQILAAPCFIEKATLSSNNDLIFNSEDMTFNRIKRGEQLIKDDTGCPWIVLYGARYTHNDDGTITPTTYSADLNIQFSAQEVTQQLFNQLYAASQQQSNIGVRTFALGNNNRPRIELVQSKLTSSGTMLYFYVRVDGQNTVAYGQGVKPVAEGASGSAVFNENARTVVEQNAITVTQMTPLQFAYVPGYDEQLYDFIIENNDKFIKSPSGGFYRIHIVDQGEVDVQVGNTSGALYNILQPFSAAFTGSPSFGNNGNIRAYYPSRFVSFTLNQIYSPSDASETVTITNDRYHALDVPYDIFCMPLSDTLILRNSRRTDWVEVTSNISRNLQAATELLAKYNAAGQIYDAQILPYCPLSGYKMDGDAFDLNDPSIMSFSAIYKIGSNTGYLFHARYASFTKTISLREPITVTDPKEDSECNLYRLCSPNYASAFEINAAMNDGIYTITVAATYKPYNPYVKLYPDFKRMYGNSFNDARGLILGGDYSLAALNDAWETYQLQNKNYQEAFDREIQSLEVQRTAGLVSDIAGAGAGAVSGAAIGSMILPGIGTLIGGALGAAAGAADVFINDKLRQENIDLTKDRFGYQLGNIKALPQTLTRTSAYNVDNKYFPFIETYTCTDEERQALRDKIKYNGMTVMVIGTIAQYQQAEPTYIKGQLIRLEGITGNYELYRAIYDEINKGVYI